MPRPPSRGSVTSPWGMRLNPNDGRYRMHYGEDTIGAGNYAPVTGTVVFAAYDKTGTGLGWAVGIRETANPSVIWWTGHHGTSAVSNPLRVSVGSKTVEGSTYLGPKGDTGAAVGAHAHQERRGAGEARPGSGTPTNPRSYYSTAAGGGSAGIPAQEDDDMFRTWYLSLTPAGNWGAFWFTPTFGAIPLNSTELEAIKRENALATGGVQQYADTVALSNLVRRAAAWLVEQIDNAVDDEGILAAVKAVDLNPEFQIPADLVAQITDAVPTADEIADRVVDVQAERLKA